MEKITDLGVAELLSKVAAWQADHPEQGCREIELRFVAEDGSVRTSSLSEYADKVDLVLARPATALELPGHQSRYLGFVEHSHATTIGQIARRTEGELERHRNIGKTVVASISAGLESIGLGLGFKGPMGPIERHVALERTKIERLGPVLPEVALVNLRMNGFEYLRDLIDATREFEVRIILAAPCSDFHMQQWLTKFPRHDDRRREIARLVERALA